MFRINRFFGMNRRGVLAVAAAASMVAAACSDDATAPQVKEPQFAAQGAPKNVAGKTIATIRISDVFGNLITENPEALFQYFNENGAYLGGISVQDNSAKDMDPTPGIIKVTLRAGAAQYKGCVHWWTQSYTAYDHPSNPWPTCNTAALVNNKVDLGTVYMRKFPRFRFKMEDMFGGGGYTGSIVFIEIDGYGDNIEDGEPGWDMDGANNGVVSYGAGEPSKIGWCETIPPTGFAPTNPVCGDFFADWESDTTIVLKHERAPVTAPAQ